MRFLPVEWHDSLPSTNTHLLARLRDEPDLPVGIVVAARAQTAGRGRETRQWEAAPGRDIACSFIVRSPAPPQQLASLAMAISLAVAQTLDQFNLHAQVKWPNDVLVQGKKICGILVERAPTATTQETEFEAKVLPPALVVGVGLNVNMEPALAAEIDRPATSIFIETGRVTDTDRLLEAMLLACGERICDWQKDGFSALREAWSKRVFGLDSHITVGHDTAKQTGILTGFGDSGELLLETKPGTIAPIWSGEIE